MSRNLRSTAVAMAVLSLVCLSSVTVAHAKIVQFKGTRAQVAAACSAIGVEADNFNSNGVGWTGCQNSEAGTSVNCNDNGDCIGEVPRIIGRLDMSVILAGPSAPLAPDSDSVPQSLSEPGSSSDVPSGAAPTGAPSAPPIL